MPVTVRWRPDEAVSSQVACVTVLVDGCGRQTGLRHANGVGPITGTGSQMTIRRNVAAVDCRAASSAALALSCHPLPTIAVTAISAGLAALAGLSPGRGGAAGGRGVRRPAVHRLVQRRHRRRPRSGQRADRQTGCQRRRVPAAGRRSRPVSRCVVAVVLSLALGWLPGLASLTVVACGWLYNLGLKATVFSFVPYAIAFGILPAVATLALPGPDWPAPLGDAGRCAVRGVGASGQCAARPR